MVLSEFDIMYVDRKTIKGKELDDQLAEAPLPDTRPIVVDFLESTFDSTSLENVL